jgi:hypothetical protein
MFSHEKQCNQLKKIKEMIKRCGRNFRNASELITRVQLTSADYIFMIHCENRGQMAELMTNLSKKMHSSQMEYYESVQKCSIREEICGVDNFGGVPCEDKFLSQFISM